MGDKFQLAMRDKRSRPSQWEGTSQDGPGEDISRTAILCWQAFNISIFNTIWYGASAPLATIPAPYSWLSDNGGTEAAIRVRIPLIYNYSFVARSTGEMSTGHSTRSLCRL